MALGSLGIGEARDELRKIGEAVSDASESNEKFINLYTSGNFQKFVSQTKIGDSTNDELNSLSNSINEICYVIEDLKKGSEEYLNRQEEINNMTNGKI